MAPSAGTYAQFRKAERICYGAALERSVDFVRAPPPELRELVDRCGVDGFATNWKIRPSRANRCPTQLPWRACSPTSE